MKILSQQQSHNNNENPIKKTKSYQNNKILSQQLNFITTTKFYHIDKILSQRQNPITMKNPVTTTNTYRNVKNPVKHQESYRNIKKCNMKKCNIKNAIATTKSCHNNMNPITIKILSQC